MGLVASKRRHLAYHLAREAMHSDNVDRIPAFSRKAVDRPFRSRGELGPMGLPLSDYYVLVIRTGTMTPDRGFETLIRAPPPIAMRR